MTDARSVVAAQAEDPGLWFDAETAGEAYLQQELRKLHAAVEATLPSARPAERPEELDELDPLARARAIGDRLTAALVNAETSSDYVLFMGGAVVGAYEAAVMELQDGRLFACVAVRLYADALRATGWNDSGGPCWCLRAQEETGEPHRPACAQARALLGYGSPWKIPPEDMVE